MRLAVACAAVLSITGCLAAPTRSSDRADPDGGVGGVVGGDPAGGDGAGDPTSDAGPTIPCDSRVELAYVSYLCAPPGMASVRLYGLALFVNRGSEAVDLTGVHVEGVTISGGSATASFAVDDGDGLLPAGEAHGALLSEFQDFVLPVVDEPWTSSVNPAMSGSFSHDLEDGASYVIGAQVRIGDMTFPLSIEVDVTDGGAWDPLDATSVAGRCLPDA